MSRQEYFKNYYRENKNELDAKHKKYYKENRKERLTYQAEYDILNRETILAKRRIITKGQLLKGIHKCTSGYADDWDIVCETYREFEDWSIKDPKFEELWDKWQLSQDPNDRPVVIRNVKKKGFIKENLHWDVRGSFSWWNEDRILLDMLQKEMKKDQQDLREKNKPKEKFLKEQAKKRSF